MLSKAELKKIGFDKIDKHRDYANLMDQVQPSGESSIKEAYAFGIGMILNFNRYYLYNHSLKALEFNQSSETRDYLENIKCPKYLHFVIGSEEEQPEITNVT